MIYSLYIVLYVVFYVFFSDKGEAGVLSLRFASLLLHGLF